MSWVVRLLLCSACLFFPFSSFLPPFRKERKKISSTDSTEQRLHTPKSRVWDKAAVLVSSVSCDYSRYFIWWSANVPNNINLCEWIYESFDYTLYYADSSSRRKVKKLFSDICFVARAALSLAYRCYDFLLPSEGWKSKLARNFSLVLSSFCRLKRLKRQESKFDDIFPSQTQLIIVVCWLIRTKTRPPSWKIPWP